MDKKIGQLGHCFLKNKLPTLGGRGGCHVSSEHVAKRTLNKEVSILELGSQFNLSYTKSV